MCGLARAQPSPLLVLLFLSCSFSPQGMNLQLLYPEWGRAPIGLLPHLDMPEHTHKHVDPRLAGNRKLVMLTTNYLTTSQSEECPQGDGVLLFTVKLLTTTLQVGTHNFEGVGLLWPPPLPGKAIKLFFSTLPKTLRFNSVCWCTEAKFQLVQHEKCPSKVPTGLLRFWLCFAL